MDPPGTLLYLMSSGIFSSVLVSPARGSLLTPLLAAVCEATEWLREHL